MHLRTLGSLALEGSTLRRPKPLLLLAYLVLEGKKCRRELADLFWMEAKDPRDCLSTALRRVNAAGRTVLVGTDLCEARVTCDAVNFRTLVRADRHEQALATYEGPFLAGLDVPLGEEIEEWVFVTRERLANRCRQAHLVVAQRALRRADLVAARRHAELAVDLPAAAPLEHHELQALFDTLQGCHSPLAGAVMRMARADGLRIVSEVPAAQPGEEPADAAPGHRPRDTLTAAATRFVGRASELAHLSEALHDPHVRLLTLHGPGGVGKSRLAIQFAREALDAGAFRDGVFLVALESLTTADQIPPAIADALGQPRRLHLTPVDQLARLLSDQHVLLILDNAEHLLPLTDLLNGLLAACPDLRVLVTSRVRLDLRREHVLPVSGLPLSDDDEVPSDALTLFLDRARQARLDYRPTREDGPAIRRICELVDGFPLGIEMAASWTHVLGAAQICAELETSSALLASHHTDAPARHVSLRRVMAHSWRLLDDERRAALRRLAVFRGGFTRQAAQLVADVSVDRLRELQDASLLRVDERGRLDRHPTVFEFAQARLAEKPDEAAAYRTRHAMYYLELLATAEDGILGGDRLPAAASLIDLELPNLRRAWRWAPDIVPDADLTLGSLVLLFYGEVRGRYTEVAEITQRTVTNLEDRSATGSPAWAAALGCNGYMRFRMGDLETASRTSLAALEAMACRPGAEAGRATFIAAVTAADVAIVEGDHDLAARRIAAAIEASSEARATAQTPAETKRAEVMAGAAHEIKGMAETLRGRYDAALTDLLLAEPLLRKHRSAILCNVLWHLGQVGRAQGDDARAFACLTEGLELADLIQYETMQAYIGAELARTHFERGELEEAERLSRRVVGLADALQVNELEVAAHSLWRRVFGARASHREALAPFHR